MRGISFVLAAVAVVAMTADFRVEGSPRPQRTGDSPFTIVDGFAFDGQADRSIPLNSEAPPTPVTDPVSTAPPATVAPVDMAQCVRQCRFRVTAEYNPVCGSNNQGYDNPGLLRCAANCGQNVRQAYMGPCMSNIRG